MNLYEISTYCSSLLLTVVEVKPAAVLPEMAASPVLCFLNKYHIVTFNTEVTT